MSHSYGIYLDGICQFENAHPFLMHLTMAKYVTHKLYNCIVVGVVEKEILYVQNALFICWEFVKTISMKQCSC